MLVVLKVAFDSVDRQKILAVLRQNNMNNVIIQRLMETYIETASVVKINNRESDTFWLEKAVSQGCKMSGQVLNISLSEEERMS